MYRNDWYRHHDCGNFLHALLGECWQPDLLIQLGGLPPETAATAFCPAASPQPDFVPLKDLLDAYPAAGAIFGRLPEPYGLPPMLALLGRVCAKLLEPPDVVDSVVACRVHLDYVDGAARGDFGA